MTGWRILQKIYTLFGPRTVLLPIHPGTKKCFREGWPHTTWEMTQQPPYQAELANGGIAVLFGPENLAGLDCDTEERVAEFLELNPQASETLQHAEPVVVLSTSGFAVTIPSCYANSRLVTARK
jgi:hypothetical protein